MIVKAHDSHLTFIPDGFRHRLGNLRVTDGSETSAEFNQDNALFRKLLRLFTSQS